MEEISTEIVINGLKYIFLSLWKEKFIILPYAISYFFAIRFIDQSQEIVKNSSTRMSQKIRGQIISMLNELADSEKKIMIYFCYALIGIMVLSIFKILVESSGKGIDSETKSVANFFIILGRILAFALSTLYPNFSRYATFRKIRNSLKSL